MVDICRSLKLCQQSFDDDPILFCVADEDSPKCLMDAFENIAISYGNLQTSQMVITGVQPELQAKLLEIMGFSWGNLTFM